MDFSEVEVAEGLRFSWNGWPSSRIEASRCIIPLGVMWTPLQPLADALCPVSYAPCRCKGCEATLNPYCAVNFEAKTWSCPWCFQRNLFPATYSGADESNLPAELYPNFSTIEYVLPVPLAPPPTFLFVVDLCQSEEELEHLKKALTHLLSLIPDDCPVGLISYGALVNVHEIGFAELSRAIVLRGDRELTPEKVKAMLGLPSPTPPGFVVPLRDCDFSLSTALDSLRPDHSFPPPGHRSQRASGAALSVAVSLVDALLARGASARILHFVGGPPTIGPGMVVDTELAESMRSHSDILRDNTHFFRQATVFYTKMAQRLVERGFAYDLMAASLDQVGAAEAKVAVESSGGLLLLTESFGGNQLRGALLSLFARDHHGHLAMCFNAVLDVTCGREVKVTGAVGPLCSMRKKGVCVSENQQGVGGTSSWKLCTLSPSTGVALYFEVVNQHTTPIPPSQPFFLQFTLEYVHSSGERRVRVATCSRRWIGPSQVPELLQGFDQEAAAVLVARLAAFKVGKEEMADILRWVDRLLVRVAVRFGEYEKDVPASFRLSSHLSLLPHFFYHLRRSPLLQTANSTPDETAFFRLTLNRETVGNSLLIIQPTLLSYSFDESPRAMLLDVASIAPDTILLLDAFFTVVLHHGANIAQWRAMGYHQQAEHEAFRRLLESAMRDAEELIKDRLPPPHLVVCDQNGSQARFLLAKLNPSSTHNSRVGSQEVIYTDDVSLEAFTMYLQKLAVQG